MNRAELKAMSKEQIKGKIGMLFVTSVIIFGLTILANFLLNLIPFVGPLVASIIITPAFSLSLVSIYLNVTKGITPSAGDSFVGFNDFWSAFKVTFFVGLFTFLWSLLFFVPGIIKSISYSASMYVLAENKGMPALEAIDRSKKMMDGHKMDYFVLSLSFIGWMLLGYITLGIAYIWIIPYISTTFANFYNSIKPVDAPIFVEATPAAQAE